MQLKVIVEDHSKSSALLPSWTNAYRSPSHEIAEEWSLSAPTPAGGTPTQSPSRSQTPPIPLSPWHDSAPTPVAGPTPTQHSRSLSQAPPSLLLSDEWLGGAAGGVTTPVCHGDSPAPSNDINVGETDKLSDWQVTIFYYQL
ncbi:hypothetical protein BT96DRAFT_994918 [Gymnopus androsaceus JB14]|uniref:Uncharacterized protein n=1 Tax=Gymnopus androsaceus JB14 TaxID=1447944 RepID=A0A6A4HN37_9AGAR|nr:hypothetical protein BT96DRAFT_994918 [Gymnopus androsaceus JB14]